MISKLYISNYGIIRSHEVSFHAGLTVITGETGAGKSIVLGAMGLLLGDRSDVSVLFDKSTKSIIEGSFQVVQAELVQWLEDEGFDQSEPLLVRREILPTGKSRAFINDSPASLQQLRQLGLWLMDISGQQESRELHSSRFQFDFLDELSACTVQADTFRATHLQWQKLTGRLAALREHEQNRLQQLDLEQYLLEELEQAQLRQEDELLALEQQLEILENAQQIQQVLERLAFQIHETENAIAPQLQDLANQINPYKLLQTELAEIHNALHSSQVVLVELARDAQRLASTFDADERLLGQLNERIDQLNKLINKHRVANLSELMEKQSQLQQSVERLQQAGAETETLEQEIKLAAAELGRLGAAMNQLRMAAIPKIEARMCTLLPAVGLVHAAFKIALTLETDIVGARQGLNKLRLLFTANQGSPAMELHKVASGGELSRIMLCLKSLLHGQAQLATVVFDEIDTGISGETAIQVGQVLRDLANKHQVILITHLPQIAARGDMHLFVSKKTSDNQTVSSVDILDNEGRVKAIAQMIAGDEAGETAYKQAIELLRV